MSLNEVTAELDYSYGQWKDWEGEKNGCKEQFFAFANEELQGESLAERLYSTQAYGDETDQDVINRIRRFNPGWILEEWRHEDREYEAILIEDFRLKPFTYINKEIGRVFRRNMSSGPVLLDEEYMRLRDPALYDEITFELPWGERVVPPLDTLSKELVTRVNTYIYSGKPKVSLQAPRDARAEELE